MPRGSFQLLKPSASATSSERQGFLYLCAGVHTCMIFEFHSGGLGYTVNTILKRVDLWQCSFLENSSDPYLSFL